MHLNSITQLQALPISALCNEFGDIRSELPSGTRKTLRAFDLDVTCTCGRVCLLFYDGADNSKAQARTSRSAPEALDRAPWDGRARCEGTVRAFTPVLAVWRSGSRTWPSPGPSSPTASPITSGERVSSRARRPRAPHAPRALCPPALCRISGWARALRFVG